MTGEFSPGDVMRCDAAVAKHMVEAECAKYMPTAPEKKPTPPRPRKSH